MDEAMKVAEKYLRTCLREDNGGDVETLFPLEVGASEERAQQHALDMSALHIFLENMDPNESSPEKQVRTREGKPRQEWSPGRSRMSRARAYVGGGVSGVCINCSCCLPKLPSHMMTHDNSSQIQMRSTGRSSTSS